MGGYRGGGGGGERSASHLYTSGICSSVNDILVYNNHSSYIIINIILILQLPRVLCI